MSNILAIKILVLDNLNLRMFKIWQFENIQNIYKQLKYSQKFHHIQNSNFQIFQMQNAIPLINCFDQKSKDRVPNLKYHNYRSNFHQKSMRMQVAGFNNKTACHNSVKLSRVWSRKNNSSVSS